MSLTNITIQDSPSRDDYEPIISTVEDNDSTPLLNLDHSFKLKHQSSIVTIFAIWNMMMGTSLLSMPWAYSHAGLLGGLGAIFLMGIICFYTASLMLTIPKSLELELQEYSVLVRLLLGPLLFKLSQLSSISILVGGCIVYWILMNNFAINIATLVYGIGWGNVSISMNASSVVCHNDFRFLQFSTPISNLSSVHALSSSLFCSTESIIGNVVPMALVFIQGPLISLRSASIFFKFNFIGTFSVFFLLAFALFKSIAWGMINLDFSDVLSLHYTPLISYNLPVYTGVLTLALFIHNCLTTIMKTQIQPKNNYRDLAIAYLLVIFTYLFLGLGIYVSFPLKKSCLRDNFLDNLESNDIYALVARAFLLIQIFTLFPLLCYMVRVQVFSLFQKPGIITDVSNSNSFIQNETFRIVFHNTVLLVVCILFGFLYPQIGTVIRYCGSFSGLILTFTLPPLMLIYSRRELGRPLHWTAATALSIVVLLGLANFAFQFAVNP